MKILVTGTAGFIGFHLAKVANSGCEANFPRKKLLERGDEVVGIDNINDYYDVNLKYGRLKELGIDAQGTAQSGERHGLAFLKACTPEALPDVQASAAPCFISTKYKTHKFYKLDLADKEAIEQLFQIERIAA